MPFKIDENVLNEFIELTKKIIDLKIDDPLRINYISVLYDIDFNIYIQQFLKEYEKITEIKDTIIEEFLLYAQKIDVYQYNENDPKKKPYFTKCCI